MHDNALHSHLIAITSIRGGIKMHHKYHDQMCISPSCHTSKMTAYFPAVLACRCQRRTACPQAQMKCADKFLIWTWEIVQKWSYTMESDTTTIRSDTTTAVFISSHCLPTWKAQRESSVPSPLCPCACIWVGSTSNMAHCTPGRQGVHMPDLAFTFRTGCARASTRPPCSAPSPAWHGNKR